VERIGAAATALETDHQPFGEAACAPILRVLPVAPVPYAPAPVYACDMHDGFSARYGEWAIVTGASSGIGAEFARQLAGRGLSLVICARRKDRLETLAAELERARGVQVRAVELDVSRADFTDSLLAAIGSLDVGLVVANAGFGEKGPFIESDPARDLQMLDVNCRAFLLLAHAFARRLVARGRGGMIFTSSTAAFQGTPFTAHYAATKGYGLQLAEGLWYELRPHGVDVLALCPGPTDTEGPRRTGVDPAKVPVKLMSVEPVVRAALLGLGSQPVVIPGATNRLAHVLVKMAPRRIATEIAGRLIRRVSS
jgi:uncharacterized protein